MRAGLNGEFELPEGVAAATWRVDSQGVVRATYTSGEERCTLTWLTDRDRTATYGIGLTEKDCEKAD